MSLKNFSVIEQSEKGWRMTKGRMRYRKIKKKFWSKLIRKSKDKVGFNGYEF